MRERIMTELRKPGTGIDIKLDRGGIEEIEFVTQYLQLRYSADLDVLYQDTLSALRSIREIGKLTDSDHLILKENYVLFRTIETYLRLSLKGTIKEKDRETAYLAAFVGSKGDEELIQALNDKMSEVSRIAASVYS
ncbi:MAG: hypothetical protein JSV21_07665, partial [Nitrospirota bacterium]